MLVGKKIKFKHTVKCEPYKEDGKYETTKEIVINDAEVIDKYRGSAHHINSCRDVFSYALVDFYLVSKDGELYHVLPKDILTIN